MATKTRRSPLQKAYSDLRKAKGQFCKGKKSKTDVKAVAKKYVDRAVKAGQTRTEAQKKANRVLSGGCSMSSAVTGTKKRKTKRKPARRKSTTRRRRR
ncbi:MAG: hypothetical protein AAF741_15620 [Bacteroidota bacterium]